MSEPISEHYAIHVSLKSIVAVVMVALALGGLYWKNFHDISQLKKDVSEVQDAMDGAKEEIDKLKLQVSILQEHEKPSALIKPQK